MTSSKEHSLLLATQGGLFFLPPLSRGVIREVPPPALSVPAVESVARDAINPLCLYCATEEGRVFRSEDGGGEWAPIWEGVPDHRLWVLVAHPTKPGLLYAGLEPVALWISEDSGSSWTECQGLRSVPDADRWKFYPPMSPHVRAITIDPRDPERIYVGIEEGGLYVSQDGGDQFLSIHRGLDPDIHTIVPHPKEQETLWAGTGGGIYRSQDGGRRWEQVGRGLAHWYTVPIHIQADPPHRVLMAASTGSPPTWRRRRSGAEAAIFTSLDGGESWEEVGATLPRPIKGMIMGLAAAPTDPRQIYAGTTDGTVFSSSDGGCSWEVMAQDLPRIEELLCVPISLRHPTL